MKDAYYFPHDSNAKDDPKCIMLIEELGLEGYGIFWMLLETLRDQPGYRAPVNMIPGLARRYNSTPEKVKAVVLRYQLFEVDEDEFFFSLSFQRRMEVIDEKRQKRSIAGQKGNIVRWGSQSDRNAIAKHRKGKESKGKESKVNKGNGRFTPPTLEEVLPYMKERGGSHREAEKFIDFYQSKDWYVGKNKMKDWKASVRNWTRSPKKDEEELPQYLKNYL